jgi:catechol 2,3-dioxygenase-like lactoylglutathione lyase family enzyme
MKLNNAFWKIRRGARHAAPDGRLPEPGGWDRVQVPVDDLDGLVNELRKKGVTFRNEIVTGRGGRQILAEDPSGNAVELFEAVPRG